MISLKRHWLNSKKTNKIIFEKLTEFGYECDVVSSYGHILKNLKSDRYDFIISNLTFPDISGEELVFNILKRTDAKIIILTSETDQMVRETLFVSGILDYIIKDKYISLNT